MKFSTLIPVQSSRLSVTVLVTACLIAGCSGSTDDASGDPPVSTNSVMSEVSNGDNASSDVSNSADPQMDTTETDTATDGTNNDATDDTPNEPVVNNPVVVDPLVQNTVWVNFDIAVPAYQSNDLRIELVWGDTTLVAMWIGDELWSAAGELPTDTEHLLRVTFYDGKGDLVLARFSEDFKTGSNVTEALQISADQFYADQFDDDGDGVSNLDESIAGRDPLLDEDALLDITDVFSIHQDNRMTVAEDFEGRLSEERPLSIMTEEIIHTDSSITLEINIDSEGTGTLSRVSQFGSQRKIHSGTRTHSDNTVSWDASRYSYDGDYGHRVNVIHTVTVVDEGTRAFVEEIDASNIGTYQFRWESSTNLTAQLVDDTSMCEPLYGSISARNSNNRSGFNVTLTSVSKEKDDTYWRVVIETTNTRFISNDPAVVTSNTSEYFARNLSNVLCDFVEF